MSDLYTLKAQARNDQGKGASRRLRREQGIVPAIIYGGTEAPANLSIQHKDLVKALENEAFYSHIITLELGESTQQVVLKDLQRHPSKQIILHADFQRVSADSKIKAHVPLHFINEETCIGVKQQGGKIHHNFAEVDIICEAGNLPEYIEVDVANMQTGDILHLSELKLPKGVQLQAAVQGGDLETPVVAIEAPKGGESEDESEDA
jgi:large subunit ribosomal protein L25